jgi:hypothetical protein
MTAHVDDWISSPGARPNNLQDQVHLDQYVLEIDATSKASPNGLISNGPSKRDALLRPTALNLRLEHKIGSRGTIPPSRDRSSAEGSGRRRDPVHPPTSGTSARDRPR